MHTDGVSTSELSGMLLKHPNEVLVLRHCSCWRYQACMHSNAVSISALPSANAMLPAGCSTETKRPGCCASGMYAQKVFTWLPTLQLMASFLITDQTYSDAKELVACRQVHIG